jgi:peptidase E
MTKYILVGGYIHKAKDGGKAFCEELVRGINNKPIKILDCMFARPRDSWEEKIKEDNIFFSKFIKDFELELALPEIFAEQIKKSDVIFLRGGKTYPLLDIFNKNPNLIKELNDKVVAGTSAGGDVIAKYYGVGKTGRVNGVGLGLLPVKFIPHWKSDSSEYLNADWEGILKGLRNYKEELPIYALAEGEFKVFNK